jgi:hypothetical protein
MGLEAALWLWIDGDQEGEPASGEAGIQAVQRLKMWVTRSVCPLRTFSLAPDFDEPIADFKGYSA